MFLQSNIMCRVGKTSYCNLRQLKQRSLLLLGKRRMSMRSGKKLFTKKCMTNTQQRRNLNTIINYIERALAKCPKKSKLQWNYEHCNHFMSPKDYEFQDIRRQTEGDYGRIIWKFRDPPDCRCPVTYMPNCNTIARVDMCEDNTSEFTVQEKRPCPYKSFAECYVKGIEKHKTECDICQYASYMPSQISVICPPSDCCMNCMSLTAEPYKKLAPYSNHCNMKSNLTSCFWPTFKAP